MSWVCNALQGACDVPTSIWPYSSSKRADPDETGLLMYNSSSWESVASRLAKDSTLVFVPHPAHVCLWALWLTVPLLFRTFQWTAGKPYGVASFHLPLSWATFPARLDLLKVKRGPHINSLRAYRSIPVNDSSVKNVKPQLGRVPSHHLYFLHNQMWCLVQVSTT